MSKSKMYQNVLYINTLCPSKKQNALAKWDSKEQSQQIHGSPPSGPSGTNLWQEKLHCPPLEYCAWGLQQSRAEQPQLCHATAQCLWDPCTVSRCHQQGTKGSKHLANNRNFSWHGRRGPAQEDPPRDRPRWDVVVQVPGKQLHLYRQPGTESPKPHEAHPLYGFQFRSLHDLLYSLHHSCNSKRSTDQESWVNCSELAPKISDWLQLCGDPSLHRRGS